MKTPNPFILQLLQRRYAGSHAIALLTEWDEFKQLDYKKIFEGMIHPAHIFDGKKPAGPRSIERNWIQDFWNWQSLDGRFSGRPGYLQHSLVQYSV